MRTNIFKQTTRGFALALLLTSLPAFGQVTLTDSWTGTQPIPDNDPSGVVYNFSLNDAATVIQNVAVTLNLSGGYNGDLYAYLTHGSGFSVLLNRVGVSAANPDGYGDSGFSASFSGSALNDVHNYQSISPGSVVGGQLTGTWAADGRNIDPASAGTTFDTAPRSALLDSFNGIDPNGGWTLFIADRSSGLTSTLTGYSVAVTAVPEPAETALVMGAILGLAAIVLKRRHVTT